MSRECEFAEIKKGWAAAAVKAAASAKAKASDLKVGEKLSRLRERTTELKEKATVEGGIFSQRRPEGSGGDDGSGPICSPNQFQVGSRPEICSSVTRIPLQQQTRDQLLETAIRFGQNYRKSKIRADEIEKALVLSSDELEAARLESHGMLEMIQLLQSERRTNGAVEVTTALRKELDATKLR